MRRQQERYRRLRAAGICVDCGFREARAGYTRCAFCAERKARQKREHYIPTGRHVGCPRLYIYVACDPDGRELFRGYADECAAYCGCTADVIYQAGRTGKAPGLAGKGYTIERRKIHDHEDEG